MSSITLRHLSADAVRALRIRAIENNRSPEREAQLMLEQLLCPEGRLHVGTALSGLSKDNGLSNKDVEALETVRKIHPAPLMWFG